LVALAVGQNSGTLERREFNFDRRTGTREKRGPRGRMLSVSLLLFARARIRREARTELAMASTQAEHPAVGSKGAAISNMVVRLMSEYTGRGPTRARTHFNDNLVTVVLQDTLTKGERSLVGDELSALVLTMRKAFQSTMGDDLVAGVEQILGRKVIAFMSDNHIDPDMAVEVFVLAPADDGAQPSHADNVVEPPPVEALSPDASS
jgi:uncharacterized protein YbcI